MSASVVFNNSFFEEMGKSAGVTALTKGKAEDIARIARSTAAVDEGDYRDGIVVRMKDTSRRSVALVVGTDWKTMLIEAKTGNLVRALKASASGKASSG